MMNTYCVSSTENTEQTKIHKNRQGICKICLTKIVKKLLFLTKPFIIIKILACP